MEVVFAHFLIKLSNFFKLAKYYRFKKTRTKSAAKINMTHPEADTE